jgi:FixJ family two-component response regulator
LPASGPGPGATVYIIDDDASVQRAFSRLLRAAGLSPLAFGSLEEFLARPLACANACVVADVRMPGANGLSLPQLLKERGMHLPIIYVTAHDTEETRERARRGGAAGYFRKPVDDQALIDAIRWALAGKRNGGAR